MLRGLVLDGGRVVHLALRRELMPLCGEPRPIRDFAVIDLDTTTLPVCKSCLSRFDAEAEQVERLRGRV